MDPTTPNTAATDIACRSKLRNMVRDAEQVRHVVHLVMALHDVATRSVVDQVDQQYREIDYTH